MPRRGECRPKRGLSKVRIVTPGGCKGSGNRRERRNAHDWRWPRSRGPPQLGRKKRDEEGKGATTRGAGLPVLPPLPAFRVINSPPYGAIGGTPPGGGSMPGGTCGGRAPAAPGTPGNGCACCASIVASSRDSGNAGEGTKYC